MIDFWLTSGWHLISRDDGGQHVPGADFMAAYFQRPEVAIEDESCDAERALNNKLTESPFSVVEEAELAAIRDHDVVENYSAILRFRDFLAEYPSLDSAYMAAAKGAKISFPPLFMEHLCHIILRGILDGETDPMKLRAAELLFRDQAVTLDDGRIMIADNSTVQLQADPSSPRREAAIDILNSENAMEYWDRSDRFDTSIDIAFTQPGLDALARVLEAWVGHFLSLSCRITPMVRIEDEQWRWHIGLDADSTSILNDLYHGEEVSEDRLKQILCLFKLEASERLVPEMTGVPIYLGIAMNNAGVIRLKPQNLLVNLPLAADQG